MSTSGVALRDWLTFFIAIGREPATSPNPPTLIKGSASDAKNRAFMMGELAISELLARYFTRFVLERNGNIGKVSRIKRGNTSKD
jgi:hypothetical protein